MSGFNIHIRYKGLSSCLAIILPLCLFFPQVLLGAENSYSVKADFVKELTMPGDQNSFLRPSRIIVDQNHDEVFVCDQGNGRVLIFGCNGILKFEFSISEYCGAALDMAVNNDGQIIILASSRTGQSLSVFDFDGQYLNTIAITDGSKQKNFYVSSLAIDDDNIIYLLDQVNSRILCYAVDGKLRRQFPIISDLEKSQRIEQVFGTLTINMGEIYLPVSTLGMVYRYNLVGKFLGRIGHKGTVMGELNFPVAVAVTSDKMVMVLDKHRYNVVCYSVDGLFLGEFGGKGYNPGWFYHPTWLAVDNSNKAYIGQIYNNKVQVCQIPVDFLNRLNEINKKEDTKTQLPDQLGISPESVIDSPDLNNDVKNFNINNHLIKSQILSIEINNNSSFSDGTINFQRGGILNA